MPIRVTIDFGILPQIAHTLLRKMCFICPEISGRGFERIKENRKPHINKKILENIKVEVTTQELHKFGYS